MVEIGSGSWSAVQCSPGCVTNDDSSQGKLATQIKNLQQEIPFQICPNVGLQGWIIMKYCNLYLEGDSRFTSNESGSFLLNLDISFIMSFRPNLISQNAHVCPDSFFYNGDNQRGQKKKYEMTDLLTALHFLVLFSSVSWYETVLNPA